MKTSPYLSRTRAVTFASMEVVSLREAGCESGGRIGELRAVDGFE